MKKPDLILVGASVRAAAFSALRAGLRPWCVDLFADADLQRCCAAQAISMSGYPNEFIDKMVEAPQAPWVYTGGLENHPEVVEHLSKLRPLWGNGASVLQKVRDPEKVSQTLQARGLAGPAVILNPNPTPPFPPFRRGGKGGSDLGTESTIPALPCGHWLCKPLASAGGMNIELWPHGRSAGEIPEGYYLQSFLEGPSYSAVYVASEQEATLLGITRQLVGEPWLHAGLFRYCGSIGPVAVSPETRHIFEKIGTILSSKFALRGLFGVDVILQDGLPYSVEVNPRYVASVEILEYSLGIAALQRHAEIFEKGHSKSSISKPSPGKGRVGGVGTLLAKGILFAATDLVFPATGPWSQQRETPVDPWLIPAFADIPHPGGRIEAGHPVLTFFVQGQNEQECRHRLLQRAEDLERVFFCSH